MPLSSHEPTLKFNLSPEKSGGFIASGSGNVVLSKTFHVFAGPPSSYRKIE